MKKLMTWSLIVASVGLTGCKSLHDSMNYSKNEDQKAVVQPKGATTGAKSSDKADDKKAMAQSSVKSSSSQNAQSKKVGYGYTSAPAEQSTANVKADSKGDAKADPKKLEDSKNLKNPADPTATEPSATVTDQKQFKKMADTSAEAVSKKPIGPDGVKPKDANEKAVPASQAASQLNYKNKSAKLRKIDDAAAGVIPSTEAKDKADKDKADKDKADKDKADDKLKIEDSFEDAAEHY